MKVSCPACDSKYTIADEKVSGRKVKVRCKSCGGQIVVDGTAKTPDESSGANSSDGDDNDATRVFSNAEQSAFEEKHANLPLSDSVLPGPDDLPPSQPSNEITWSVNVSETDERSLTTEQLVSAYMNGELEGEVYVWHDGLPDWSLILNVPELARAINDAKAKKGSKPVHAKPDGKSSPTTAKLKSEVPPSSAGQQQKKALPTAGKGGLTAATKAVTAKDVAADKKTAARATTAKRPQNAHDIFAAASQAQDDVDISVSQEEEQKKTGARNESSVLFSLDALKAGIVSSPQTSAAKPAPGRKGAPVAPRKKLEDLMSTAAPMPLTVGSTSGPLGMSTNQALLTAPAPPPPKPEPKPVVISSVPPAAPGTAAPAAPAYVPPPKKKSSKLVAIGAIVGIVAIGGIAAAVFAGGKKEVTVASASVNEPTPAVPTPSAVEPVKTPESPPADTKPAEAVASASAAPTTPAEAAPTTPGNTATKNVVAANTNTAKPTDKKEPTKKEEKKPEPAAQASSGNGGFNKGAAIQALSVAASQATICKKPDGPTGTGKVTITFAPSGRATTAIVSGGSFGGTPVGGCVSNVFKRAKVPPFDGDPVTVSKSFTITL
jgi:predicted Zn finger-like uncharacterized protein